MMSLDEMSRALKVLQEKHESDLRKEKIQKSNIAKGMGPDGGKPTCKGCGYRIRGYKADHEAGSHHHSGGRRKK